MKRTAWLLLLVAGCGSSGGSSGGGGAADSRLVGEADFAVARTVQSGEAVAFRLGGSTDTPPPRLARDFKAGRRWLSIDRPLGFSFVGRALLEGRTDFRPARASLAVARPTGDGAAGGPTLLRLHGLVDGAAIAARIERVAKTDVAAGAGLGGLLDRDEELRVLLGNGIDAILSMVGPDKGGAAKWDSRDLVGVVDAEGRAVSDWPERFRDAVRARSLDGLREVHVVASRYRATQSPRETFFKFPADLLGLAAQMTVEPQGRDFRWTWEGLWRGALDAEPGGATDPAWPDAPAFVLNYKEYRPGRVRAGVWHTLLKPVTLPFNYAAKAFDPYEGQRGDDGWK